MATTSARQRSGNRTGTGIGVSQAANLVLNNNSRIDAVGVAGTCPTASASSSPAREM